MTVDQFIDLLYVVAFEKDADPQEKVWTLSKYPDETGWETDSGYDGYGLTKDSAQLIANAFNNRAHIAESSVMQHNQIATDLKSNNKRCEISDVEEESWHALNETLAKRNYIGKARTEFVNEMWEAIRPYLRITKPVFVDLDNLKLAIDGCLDDTWECPSCGHSESWWKGSNAHYESKYPYDPGRRKMSIRSTKMTYNQELAGGIAENLGLSDKKRQWIWDYLKHHNKAADAEQPDERTAFEAWIRNETAWGSLRLSADNQGYHNPYTNAAWEAWKARPMRKAVDIAAAERAMLVVGIQDPETDKLAIACAEAWGLQWRRGSDA